MRPIARLALLCLMLPFAAVAADAPARHPITHEDLWLMKRPGSVVVSPDGRWIVVSVSEPAYDDASRASDLWVMASDGSSPPRRLTGSKGGEGDVVFSDDSRRLAFVAKREGDDASQVYVLDLAGGEALRATSWATGASSPQFSPDGRSLLFVSMTFPGAKTDDDNRKALADRKARKYNVRTYESFPIRHWDRWLDETRPSVIVQPLDGASPARDLLAGTALRDDPGYGGQLGNEGDSIDATWTPDGRGVVFIATTLRNKSVREEAYRSLWLASLDGGEPRRLTTDEDDYSSPQFTKDGRTLLATVQPSSKEWVYVADRLAAWSWPGPGARRVLTSSFDGSVGDFAAAPDGRRVYFLSERHGRVQLYQVPLAGGEVTQVGKLETGMYSRLSIGGSAKAPVAAALWTSSTNPAEVGRLDLSTGRWTRLSSFNVAKAATLDLSPVEEFWFTAKDGQKVHNFLVRPAGFDPSKKYPLFVVIHGGPHSAWMDDFVLRWNYDLLAAPGYVLVLTNYKGSTGFGETYARSIQFDPLEGPGNQVNEAADEAIKRYPFIDGSRQAAGGASYGGHLANWMAVTTDRYKALVSHAGLYDLKSQWTTSDVAYSRERNIGGPAWDTSIQLWREQSPFYRSTTLKTPVLVTCGERDYRVPCNNAIEFFMVLQREQVPSKLVIYTDQNHWILKGEDSRHFYEDIANWLAKYL